MEKKFTDLTYYDMLDIRPEAALFEIRHAYNNARQMYESGSLVSYSLFSEREREQILDAIEKAYLTLIDERERRCYDQQVFGALQCAQSSVESEENKKPVSIFQISRDGTSRSSGRKTADLRLKIQQMPKIAEILAKPEISGLDLLTIRTMLEVDLAQIATETRIRLDYLRAIEESDVARLPAPVFLKGFVKAYLKFLGVDEVDAVSARYMSVATRPAAQTVS